MDNLGKSMNIALIVIFVMMALWGCDQLCIGVGFCGDPPNVIEWKRLHGQFR